MDDDKLLVITFNIAGRPFKAEVKWKDEYKYREAAKEVNDKFEAYSKKRTDPFDRLALVAFQHTLEKNNKSRGEETFESREKIGALTALIETALEQD